MKVICNRTNLTTNYATDWYPFEIQGANPKRLVVIQGYWTTAGVTRDSTVKIQLTTNPTLAVSNNMYDETTAVTMNTADGKFTFNIDNYGYKFYRLVYTLNTSSGVTKLYAESNAEEV